MLISTKEFLKMEFKNAVSLSKVGYRNRADLGTTAIVLSLFPKPNIISAEKKQQNCQEDGNVIKLSVYVFLIF